MKNKSVEIAFKKLLGNGRAWRTPVGFTSEFLEILISPLVELKEQFINLKYTHFPTFFQNKNNIINGEELFGIIQNSSNLEERANNIELSWRKLAGNSSYATLEYYLRQAGFDVYVMENISGTLPNTGTGFMYGFTQYNSSKEGKKAQYGGRSSKVIGNGMLNIAGTNREPTNILDGSSSFYVIGFFDPNDSQWDSITEIILKFKPAHTVAICQIAERKVADNEWASTEIFGDNIDGGKADTKIFREWLNK